MNSVVSCPSFFVTYLCRRRSTSFVTLYLVGVQVDAIGGTRFDDGSGGDNEVQRTMLEIVNQLDGFDSRGNIKV
jgi:ATP-dependent 26S proteasome regulatory subunit